MGSNVNEARNFTYGPIENNGGTLFTGVTNFNDVKEVIFNHYHGQPKRKRSDEDFKSFNRHFEVPNNASAHFTGRADILCALSERLLSPSKTTSQQRFVLYGLGGSGKTQIALKFAEDNRERFWGVFWIDATNATTVDQSFVEVARAADLLERNPKAAKRWLSNIDVSRPWLMIIDNADDPKTRLAELFPTGNRGTVLVTTRNPNFRHYATAGWGKVDVMVEDEAVELLLKGISSLSIGSDPSPDTIEHATEIVTTLGFIPLAIAQAAGAIRNHVCGIAEYCKRFRKNRKYLMERQQGDESSNYLYTTYATWEISVTYLKGRSEQEPPASYALALLNFLAFMHFTGIGEGLFNLGIYTSNKQREIADIPIIEGVLFEDSEEDGNMYFREARSLLSSLSLIQVESAADNMAMHPVVHAWARDRMSTQERKEWTSICTEIIHSIASYYTIPIQATPSTGHAMQRRLVPHIQSMIDIIGVDEILKADVPGLRSLPGLAIGQILLNTEDLATTERLLHRCLEINKPKFNESRFGREEIALMKISAILWSKQGQRVLSMRILDMLMNLAIADKSNLSNFEQLDISMIFTREVAFEKGGEALELAIQAISGLMSSLAKDNDEEGYAVATKWQLHLAELLVLNSQFEKAMMVLTPLVMALSKYKREGKDDFVAEVDFLRSSPRFYYVLAVATYNLDFGDVPKEETWQGQTIRGMETALKLQMHYMGPDYSLTLQTRRALEIMKEGVGLPRELWVYRYL